MQQLYQSAQAQSTGPLSQGSLPNFNEINFAGPNKDRIINKQIPRANMPHLKRVINQQVFLEETDPYVYDENRRNLPAMEAAQQILNAGLDNVGPNGELQSPVGMNMLPALGPQGAGPS